MLVKERGTAEDYRHSTRLNNRNVVFTELLLILPASSTRNVFFLFRPSSFVFFFFNSKILSRSQNCTTTIIYK